MYRSIISTDTPTEIVYTQSLSLKSSCLSPQRNLRVMHLRVSNFRYRYLHAVSTSLLHNMCILRVVAQATPRSTETQEQPLVLSIPHLPSLSCLICFCSRYRPVIPTKVDSRDRTASVPTCATRASRAYNPLNRYTRNPPPSFLHQVLLSLLCATSQPFSRKFEREQIRYPLAVR